jgi:hypothetical protein
MKCSGDVDRFSQSIFDPAMAIQNSSLSASSVGRIVSLAVIPLVSGGEKAEILYLTHSVFWKSPHICQYCTEHKRGQSLLEIKPVE